MLSRCHAHAERLRGMVLAVNEKYPEQHSLPGSEIIVEASLVTAELRSADRPDSSQSELRSLSFEVLCDFIRCSSIAMLPHIMRHRTPNIMQRLFAVLNALCPPGATLPPATSWLPSWSPSLAPSSRASLSPHKPLQNSQPFSRPSCTTS